MEGGSAGAPAVPTVIAAAQQTPAGIAVGESYVYWTNLDGGEVMRVPHAGGEPSVVVAQQAEPFAIAVDATNLYWVAPPTLWRLGLAEAAPEPIADAQFATWGLALNQQSAFWSTENRVTSVPLTGGSSTIVTGGYEHARGIAVNDTDIYVADCDGGTLARSSLAGEYLLIADLQGCPLEVAIDGESVYWTDYLAGAVRKAPLGGGASQDLATGQDGAWGIAVDETSAYWANAWAGTICKAPIGGGPTTVLASQQDGPWYIAVAETSVYWTNRDGKTVMRGDK